MKGLPVSNGEPSPARKALTALVLAVALFAAVVVQLTVVNRLPLPGGAAPDLVLLLVTAIGVTTSPLAGAVAGFAGGLALDVAPPAIHYVGEYALVFCLAGWGAARVDRAIWDVRGQRDPMITFSVMAGAAAAGEAGKAALGMMLSDPDVTGAVASRVLPTAIMYDLLLAPFAFLLVARITRGAVPERAPAPEFSRAQRLALVFRQASAGAAPNLRLAGTGENYHRAPLARNVPRLRLSSGRAGSSLATGAAATGGATVPLAGGRAPRLNFGGDLPARTGQVRTGSRAPGKNWLRGAAGASLAGSPALGAHAAAAARHASRGPGRGWLQAARPAGPGAKPVVRGPGSGWITAGSLAGPSAKRVVRGPGSGWITAGSLAGPSAKRGVRGPGSGWITAGSLAGPSAKRGVRGPGSGWITAGSLAGPSAKRASRTPGKNWITAGSLGGPIAQRASRGPGRGWLRATDPRGSGGGLAAAGLSGPRSAAAVLAARSAPSGLSALSGGGTPMAGRYRQHGAPRAGWLGASRLAAPARSGQRLAPRRGWLSGPRRPPGAVFGSAVLGGGAYGHAGGSRGTAAIRAAAFRGTRAYHDNWYTAAPSRAWLRRSRHPWRKRSKRLLRLVGVGR